MSKSNFENLRVYRLAETVADDVWEIVIEWDAFAKSTVGKQLVRSADSVGANIAEGNGRGTYADNRRFVRTARGSLKETRHWLRRAFRRKLLSAKQVEKLRNLLDSLSPQLNAYLESIGTKEKKSPAPISLGSSFPVSKKALAR